MGIPPCSHPIIPALCHLSDPSLEKQLAPLLPDPRVSETVGKDSLSLPQTTVTGGYSVPSHPSLQEGREQQGNAP